MQAITLKTIAALVFTLLVVPAMAQEDGSGGLVAVLDVAKVFKNNAQFDHQLERIKQEAESMKVQIQKQQESIRQRAQQVMQMEVGSAERNKQEAEIEQEQTSLRTRARQIEADLLKREAKIYHDAYVEMQQVVARIANEYGISLVLRFDSNEIDPENRAEVVKGVNRAVVYHHRLDLTNMVIEKMSPSSASLPTNQK